MVTNWKTYESQNRLLAAIVAAHPELKLNFKCRSCVFFESSSLILLTVPPQSLLSFTLKTKVLVFRGG